MKSIGTTLLFTLQWLFCLFQAGICLLKLHADLQKFQIILEDVAQEDGESLALKHMMVSTRNFLKQVVHPFHNLHCMSSPGVSFPEVTNRPVWNLHLDLLWVFCIIAFLITTTFLKMEAIFYSKTVVPTYQTVETDNWEGLNMSLQQSSYLVDKKKVKQSHYRPAGPEVSRRLRLPDFKTIGTWRW